MKTVVFFIGSLQAGGTEAKLARNFLPQHMARGRVNPKIPTESADAMAGALIEVLSQRELRESLSALSNRRAQDFGLDASLRQWEDALAYGEE